MQVKQNNHKENQENKPRSLVKKLSFLWVIAIGLIIHLWIKDMNLNPKDGLGKIIILWFVIFMISQIIIYYNCNIPYKNAINSFYGAESDVSIFNGTSSETRLKIEKNGIAGIGLIINVVGIIRYRTEYTIITYCFMDSSDIKHEKTKVYNTIFLEKIPNIGDKIKIIYDESNLSDSVIFHEEINPKVKWYQQKQKKFTITIINNTK